MQESLSRNVCLYGTDEPPTTARLVEAGPLSVLLEDGALRRISLAGHEALRGIAFIVRDKDWGTFRPVVSNLDVVAGAEHFRIHYEAECGDGRQALHYAATITATISGSADGTLVFEVRGAAKSPFLTCRTGFVVLHPVDVAGAPVTVTHTDGTTAAAEFPRLISPSQPFRDVRALRHEVAPGLHATCTMEGDVFETEDQRNWTDASYKTYVRPLARPHPYVLEPGKAFVQRVTLAIDGRRPRRAPAARGGDITITVGESGNGRLPVLALAVDPAYPVASTAATTLLRQSGVRWLVCAFDTASGHDVDTMRSFRQLQEASGARLVLEAVLALRDGSGEFSDDARVLAAEITAIRRHAERAGVSFEVVSAAPACYRQSYQPSGPWPSAPPLRDFYTALRRAFPGSTIAGGMHSYFTELNRHPPPADALDIVTHSTCPIVHAADDVSVMETLEALPWVFSSARELVGARPYWIAPTAIGMRFNPYGAAPAANPENVRVAMAMLDPRQRGLFNAAWTLGYIARAATADVDNLCLSALAGPHAISWQPHPWQQPWFDRLRSASAVFPVYSVIAGLAGNSGAVLCAAHSTRPSAVAALAFETDSGPELWLANLTRGRCTVALEGVGLVARTQRLDAETFEDCCSDPQGFAATAAVLDRGRVELDAYAVMRISNG